MSTPQERKARVLDAVRRVPSPTRREVRRGDLGILLAAVVASLVVFAAVGGIRVGSRPLPLIVGSGAAWGAIAAAVTALALFRGHSMLGAPRAWLLGGALAIAPLLALTWACLPVPSGDAATPHAFGPDAVCFAVTIALAAGPLYALVRARSEGDPVRPVWTGAALGAASGAWGAVLIDLHCDRVDVAHVLLGHVAPVLLLTAVGAVWARAALTVRDT